MKKIFAFCAALSAAAAFAAPGEPGVNRDYWTGVKLKWPAQLIKEKIAPSGSDVLKTTEGVFWKDAKKTKDFGSHYAQRIYGFLIPPADGQYVFCLTADDNGMLSLSTDDSPKNLKMIARCDYHSRYNMFDRTKSKPVALKKGRKYYIQIDMWEYEGEDHLQVAWIAPGEKTPVLIPTTALQTVK